jgi:hypothetical protein
LIEEETLLTELNTNMKTKASLGIDRMYKEIGMFNKDNTRSIVIEACEIGSWQLHQPHATLKNCL